MLALVALISVPLSDRRHGAWSPSARSRCSSQQWGETGKLNGHIEETYSGHALVKVFGHQARGRGGLRASATRRSTRPRPEPSSSAASSCRPSCSSGTSTTSSSPSSAGCGSRPASMSLGDVQAFIQYSRQFSQPLTQVASMSNLLQSGVASAERVFELLDADEQVARPGRARSRFAEPQGRVEFEHVSFRYAGRRPAHRATSRSSPSPGQSVAIVGPDRRRQDHARQPHHAVLRARLGTHHARRRRHRHDDARPPARRDRHGAAGHLAVRRHDPRQHRLRPPGRHRRGDPRRRAGDLRRPLRARPARRLRHRDRRRGRAT